MGVSLHSILAHRIVILDGAMGTMLQHEHQGEDPQVVSRIHRAYLDAGADIISTNTFLSTSSDANQSAARLARAAADEYATDARPRFVAGVVGPARNVSVDAHRARVRGLIDGGVDALLFETIIDAHSTQTALAAAMAEMESRAVVLPLMISATVTDPGGRRAAALPVAEFYSTVRAWQPFSVGLNCAFGARTIKPSLQELAAIADCYVSCHPSAGLPDAGGRYPEQPHETAALMRDCAAAGLVNIVGGCCGTTPEYIRAIAQAVENVPPRPLPRTARAGLRW